MEFIPVTEKRCPKCGATKPFDAFSKNKGRKDGLQAQCKTCAAEYQRSNPEKVAAKNAAWRQANPEKVKAQHTAWYQVNTERAKSREAAYRQANPEKVAARNKTWQRANTEKVAARNAAYRRANPEKVAARNAAWQRANTEKNAAYKVAYVDANRPAFNARNQARKALKLQAIPGWADKDAITILYAKAKEISPVFGIELTVDHVVPLKSPLVCGLHTPDNLQLLEKLDNIRKGNRSWPDMPGGA